MNEIETIVLTGMKNRKALLNKYAKYSDQELEDLENEDNWQEINKVLQIREDLAMWSAEYGYNE
jgi:hypothetical protein